MEDNSLKAILIVIGLLAFTLIINRFTTMCMPHADIENRVYKKVKLTLIVTKKEPNSGRKYIFEIYGKDPSGSKKVGYSTINEDQYNTISIGDTLKKDSGTLTMYLCKKDTILKLKYEEASWPLLVTD